MKNFCYSIFFFAVVTILGSKLAYATEQVKSLDTGKKMPKLSVQLWSVRDDVKQDIKQTLTQLANLGFEGVEFAGEFGPFADNPDGLAVFLKRIGLEASGAHVSFEQLSEKNFEQTITFYQTLGAKNLIIGSDSRAWSDEGIDSIVKLLTSLAKKMAPFGMRIGYHNHAHEFDKFQGSTFWDYLARNTPKEVILQQDVGWTVFAGKDPVAYVQRYPGRTLTTHYKASLPEGTKNKLPIIGKDTIDWKGLLSANIAFGETEWIVVEQEEYPNKLTPLQAVAASLSGLQKYIEAL